MNAVIHAKRNGKLYAIERLQVYDTRPCATILNYYPTNKLIINPDASGNARSTSTSDFAILKQNGFEVSAPKRIQQSRELTLSI
jgi:hypothetical protein